jgi:hypothetical protein
MIQRRPAAASQAVIGADEGGRGGGAPSDVALGLNARIVRHGRYVVLQLAEVAVSRSLFAGILRRIDELRPRSPPLPA